MFGCFGSCGVAGFDHLHCVCWTEDFGLAGLLKRREHFYAMEIAAIGDFQFDESVADLGKAVVNEAEAGDA